METGVVIGGVILAVVALLVFTIARLIIIVPPNMAAAITGRERKLVDGSTVGYRTVTGGRTVRVVPLTTAISVAAFADEQHEAGRRRTAAGVRSQEVGSFLENRKRF